ncbi:cobalamin-5'-phosphate synthase [Lachnospiraceae bacterium]|nr:cobalamin-5'-phosphate synthase [Lachnospiraceae bacterium]
MKTAIQAFVIAFSMYSKIPMPVMKWEEKGMKYAMCFFPLIGAVEGLLFYLLGRFLIRIEVSELLFGCIMAVLPILITGGIHFDGFLDTMDGINSYGDHEKRLEILKDSNSGAFAIIGGLVYFVLYVGFLSELTEELLPIAAVNFCLSRALSGSAVVLFPNARKKGLLKTFSQASEKGVVLASMILYAVVSLIVSWVWSPLGALVLFTVGVVTYAYHYYNCMHNFGGITGDLAGYFLQINELAAVIGIVVLHYI